MNIEGLVTSQSMSQKLADAGFKIECSESWGTDRYHVPIYTFRQLWEVLPETSVLSAHTESIKIPYDQTGQLVRGAMFSYEHRSLPDTAAEAVLFCMENGYIKSKQRLQQLKSEQE